MAGCWNAGGPAATSALLLCGVWAALASPAGATGASCVRSVQAPLIDAVIAGHPVRLRLDFGATAPVMLTPAAAARLALESDVRPGTKEEPDRGRLITQVGRKRVSLPWSRETVAIDGVAQPMEVVTASGYAAGGADGTIRPSALPCAVVRFEQRAARPGDAETVLPLMEGDRFDALTVRAAAGRETIEVVHAPWRAQSMGTAATGGALAELLGGSLTGPVGETPVVYGVTRPARLLRLDRPWPVGGVQLREMLMRVSDWEGRGPVPPDADLDRDLIQVTVRRNAQRGQRFLQLGQDVLGACASLEWRREARVLVVRCPRP